VAILARILRERGLVGEDQIELAIQHQVLYGGRLGTSLLELGFITEEGLTQGLARLYGVPGASIDPRDITPETVALLPRATVARYKVFPWKLKGKTLFLLMMDPQDHSAVARISLSQGYIVRPLVVPEFRMVQLLRDHYGIDERWRFDDTYRPPVLEPTPASPRDAVERFEWANTRDEVVEALLALCLNYFKRVAFFIVREPWVVGWAGIGEGMERGFAASLRIPLDRPSVFRDVVRDKSVFIGRLGPEEENRRFLKEIGKRLGTAALFPVLVRGRVVNLVYGDGGPGGNVRGDLGELLALAQKVPRAYLRIIRRRIADAREVPENAPKE
jgi:Type II secretion system (T2SS), protein E, N-terminal domain